MKAQLSSTFKINIVQIYAVIRNLVAMGRKYLNVCKYKYAAKGKGLIMYIHAPISMKEKNQTLL